MNFVDPIRDKSDIHKMYVYLQSQSMRDYLLFKFAIHTGIKLNELLNLAVKDVYNDHHEIVHVWVASSSEEIRVIIPEKLRNELKWFIDQEKLQCDDLLFQSKRTKKGLSRQQAYRIINAAATRVGIEHIGLTTLRKTFAYHTYRSGVSISIIQKYLGHQTSYETMKFIGITKKEINTTIALNL
ncbi:MULTISPECIES: tyrosine-type recombinase/integrase [Staphylococcus]|uniref:Integrase n=1 Tax=Staphylococcus agnetis TaxID=985762 RepID=A0A085UER8_9STAP|nr:tyrosine-type recombinase/integrase [Staphylococcus agnetis]NHM76115.1 tyrosine-type recombinase/integrase [Staphylococcus sp. 11007852]NHM92255.1 tyrosine-type recombinase/integrase [Staphylococcus sp. 10602379]ALN77926.1 tyrosine-type recombinase/integrase [Staphylococcus agnetis]KFE41681.1 DNA integration/recombination/inversion protein [Staphylococcus agnetis]MBY7665633.1 tyrosine-type recombinase/integrase [Staphylococcus agnetis]